MTNKQKSLTRSWLLFSLLIVFVGMDSASAQFVFRWMNIGAMQSPYSSGGAAREQEPFDNAALSYPAIDHRPGNSRAQGMWVGATDYTDESGRFFPFKVAHIGPRAGGEVQFFNKSISVNSKLSPAPEVLVDAAQSFDKFVAVDAFESTQAADRMIHVQASTRVGVEMDQKVHAFMNEHHDNYHILEYTFTNDGDVDGDGNADVTSDLTGVYFFFLSRYAPSDNASWVTGDGAPWGKFTMNDAVGDGHEDYDVDFRAQYAWFGRFTGQAEFNNLGGPLWKKVDQSAAVPDTTGRLAAGNFMGRVYIHADASASDETDDPLQPSTMGVMGSDEPDLVDDEFNDDLMRRQYEDWITSGRIYPHHADIIEPSGDFAKAANNPWEYLGRNDAGGYGMIEAFGPYDLPFGADVHLVIAEAVAGLSEKAKLDIGKAYRDEILFGGGNHDIPITYNGVTMTKNEWVMTAKDSLFQTFERAIANWESGMNIPAPPSPPLSVNVTSLPDQIMLEWETYPGASQTGWEVYRAAKTVRDPTGYQLVATLDALARSYSDTELERGLDYYYYIQAVGSENSDPTGLTPTGKPLRSGRYMAQTYLPANLKRPAGTDINNVRVVPNPFNLGADAEIRWPDQQDKLGFLDIPGECTITIYTQLGEKVAEIEHTNGSGDEFWDHTTASRQVVASGVYIAMIVDHNTGDQVFKKFVIIR